MTTPTSHDISYETNELGRHRAVCTCGWKSSTSNDKSHAERAGLSHTRSKRMAAERMAAKR